MIKKILDFEGTSKIKQFDKIAEEYGELVDEMLTGNVEREISEGCDLIQAIYTRWTNMGMNKEDIERAWNEHYKKESLRGRKIVEIEGKSTNDLIISGLLGTIRLLEKDNRNLQNNVKTLMEELER